MKTRRLGLVGTMAAFGALGIALALLILGLGLILGWLGAPGNIVKVAGWLGGFGRLVWLVWYFSPAIVSPQPGSWQIWTLYYGAAALNFIPWAVIGLCFYFARLGVRRLRSRQARPDVQGPERQ